VKAKTTIQTRMKELLGGERWAGEGFNAKPCAELKAEERAESTARERKEPEDEPGKFDVLKMGRS
jgi:hypothetical protein